MPSAAKSKKPVDPFRRALYGKIEIAKKQLGLDEDTYRDLLEGRYGKRSRTALGNAQLVDLVEHFKALGFKQASPRRPPTPTLPLEGGGRKMADGREARKCRALWLSGWHLGVVRDPSEAALNRFVKRLSGVDDMRWMDGASAAKAIEALKDLLAREGHVDWAPYPILRDGVVEQQDRPRARVLEAQWRRLHALGEARVSDTAALHGWLDRFLASPCRASHLDLAPADADRAIAALGAKIRAALKDREPVA